MITSFSILAEASLSLEEQKRLIEDNKQLKSQLKEKQGGDQVDSQQSQMIMEKLKAGKKFQEDQQKALEELDKE
jgi:hypothetical protein